MCSKRLYGNEGKISFCKELRTRGHQLFNVILKVNVKPYRSRESDQLVLHLTTLHYTKCCSFEVA